MIILRSIAMAATFLLPSSWAAGTKSSPNSIQKSSGSCSPNIVGSGNNINCDFGKPKESHYDEFHADFTIPIIVSSSNEMPVLLPGTFPGGAPFVFTAMNGPKEEIRQRALAGIAYTSILSAAGPGVTCNAPLVGSPAPGHEDEYFSELIEFALLREVENPGMLNKWMCATQAGNSRTVQSGMGAPSPLSNPLIIESNEALKFFPANRFAKAFSVIDTEKLAKWRIPKGTKMYSEIIPPPDNDAGGRRIVLLNPGTFIAQIRIIPIGMVTGFLPVGFSTNDFLVDSVATRTYGIRLHYRFLKTADGNERLTEYKSWLDTIFRDIQARYSDPQAQTDSRGPG